MPGHPACSACGSRHYAAYVEGMFDQQPVGDADLPPGQP